MNIKELETLSYNIDHLVKIFSTVIVVEKIPIINFTKDDLDEFVPLFQEQNFVKLLKNKSIDRDVVVITNFNTKVNFLISIMSAINFLRLEKTPLFNEIYKVDKEEKEFLRARMQCNKLKYN